MGIALNSAVSGLAAAQTRFASAAERVTTPPTGVPEGQKLRAPERSAGIRPPANIPESETVRDVVDLKQAELGYKAAAKVLSAISDTEKNLLDILS